MLKKTIALLIIFAMLVPFSSAVAADKMRSQPTTEEIMSEQHVNTIGRQSARKIADASTASPISDPEQNLVTKIINNVSFDNDLLIVHDQEKNNQIDDLFALRCELAIDYEKNQEKIDSYH